MEKTVLEGKISGATIIFRLCIDFLAIAIFIGLIWFIRDIIWFFTTKIIITDKRIVGKIGLINTNQLDSPLNKISGVAVRQGLFGKICNYGTISITTASTAFCFPYIEDPHEFRKVLNDQIEKYDDERIKKQAQELAAAMKG